MMRAPHLRRQSPGSGSSRPGLARLHPLPLAHLGCEQALHSITQKVRAGDAGVHAAALGQEHIEGVEQRLR
jgi:hypothetical protein